MARWILLYFIFKLYCLYRQEEASEKYAPDPGDITLALQGNNYTPYSV